MLLDIFSGDLGWTVFRPCQRFVSGTLGWPSKSRNSQKLDADICERVWVCIFLGEVPKFLSDLQRLPCSKKAKGHML